ncbi:MAG: hypothetical protein QOI52_1906, partial [Chloroflexota bacterium]|nr:hypothetical protein [Chloroflexota bacterium]
MSRSPRVFIATLVCVSLIGLSNVAIARDQAAGTRPRTTAADLKPHIVQKFIPFGQKRKDQMA